MWLVVGLLLGFCLAGLVGWWLGRNDLTIEWEDEP